MSLGSHISDTDKRPLSLKFPWRVVATAAAVTAAAIRAAATGCLGFLGHDVRGNVLHLLSLLVQRKLLGVLGFAFLCRDSA